MDMNVNGRKIEGVSIHKSEFFGDIRENTPEAKIAMAQDALVVEDASGQSYRIAKKGLYNVDKAYQGRGTEIEVDGKVYKHVHNINVADTPGEKVWWTLAGGADKVKTNVELFALRIQAGVMNLMMGLASK